MFSQHMFPARLNWETFASTTMFPCLTRPLEDDCTKGKSRSLVSEIQVNSVLKIKTILNDLGI